MPLIEKNALVQRFVELLEAATHVDIAVAWVGPGIAVDRLLEHARQTHIRIAVGMSGNATEPATLRRLLEHVELRTVPEPSGGMFHPKFYRFRAPQSTVCWIGSANFTRKGFGGNTELMHEFLDSDNVAEDWFERLWRNLDDDPEPTIAHYEERYKECYKRPRLGGDNSGRQVPHGELPNLQDIKTWDDFVSGLRILDKYCRQQEFGWDVLVACAVGICDNRDGMFRGL